MFNPTDKEKAQRVLAAFNKMPDMDCGLLLLGCIETARAFTEDEGGIPFLVHVMEKYPDMCQGLKPLMYNLAIALCLSEGKKEMLLVVRADESQPITH